MNYPISDMALRIKNAYKGQKDKVAFPHSGIKEKICSILKRDGFIEDFKVTQREGKSMKDIEIKLGYFENKKPTILEIKVTSTPSLRFYKGAKEIRPYKNGLGVELFSTSSGILTDSECKEKNVGGLSLLRVF